MILTMTKKLFITWLTVIMIAIGWIVGIVLKNVIPGSYFEWYPFIPFFFYILGWITIYLFEACRTYAPQKLQLVYLGIKFIKLILSLIVLLIYTVKIQEHKMEFAITFFVFYLISLTFESIFFYRYEKKKKDLQYNKKE